MRWTPTNNRGQADEASKNGLFQGLQDQKEKKLQGQRREARNDAIMLAAYLSVMVRGAWCMASFPHFRPLTWMSKAGRWWWELEGGSWKVREGDLTSPCALTIHNHSTPSTHPPVHPQFHLQFHLQAHQHTSRRDRMRRLSLQNSATLPSASNCSASTHPDRLRCMLAITHVTCYLLKETGVELNRIAMFPR